MCRGPSGSHRRFSRIARTGRGGTGTIQGVVRSGTGAVEGVSVTVVGTTLGAVTRADGRYAIANVPAGAQTVRASRIGFARQDQATTVVAGQAVTVNFDLTAAAVSLDQVVVTGYGSSARRDVTGSIATVSSADIATLPVPRVDQAISGLVAGVQVQTTNAQPGSEMRIRIRGGNSLNGSNEPLVVVDGVIGADLNQINPNDVESVDVLKDASATAIYGARGANGVVIVSTKRGTPGSMRFNYSGYTGSQNVSKHIDLLNADEFAKMFMRNPNHDKTVTLDTTVSLASTDWQNTVFQIGADSEPRPPRERIERRHQSDGRRVALSAGRHHHELHVQSRRRCGSTSISSWDRASTAGTRVTYSRSTSNAVRVNDGYGTAGGPVTMDALRWSPTIPVYAADGSYSAPLLSSQAFDNPVAIVNLLNNRTTTDYLLGNVYANVELLPELTFRSSLSYTSNDGKQQVYTSRLLRAALGSGQANINTRRHYEFPHGEHAHAASRHRTQRVHASWAASRRRAATATAPPRRALASRAICSATIG